MSRSRALVAQDRMTYEEPPERLGVLACVLLLAGCTVGIPVLGEDGGPVSDAGSDAASDAGSCPGREDCPACLNGLDDDEDGRTDYPSDPGCVDRSDDDEGAVTTAGPCADGTDDDGDRLIDYPDDPGCTDEEDADETDPPPPACSNGSDDDGDGFADHPLDPGCSSARDTDESDACPGPTCPSCANGSDDDGDGAVDYPDDHECGSRMDDDEGCIDIGEGFENAWPGALTDLFGDMPTGSRRASAAHSGRYGLFSPENVTLDPTVLTGAPGERASVWARSFSGEQILALHFAIAGRDSYACMLNLADELVAYEMGDGVSIPHASVPAPRDEDRWYRIEVAFEEGDVATCSVTEEGASTPLATVSYAFERPLAGPVGVRGAEPTGFDELEVCR